MDPGVAGLILQRENFFGVELQVRFFGLIRKNNVTATMMTQYMPSDKYPLREELKTLLYSSLSN